MNSAKGKRNLGILISGGGSNMQAIVQATRQPLLSQAQVAVVISNNKDAGGLERAKKLHVPAVAISPKDFPNRTAYFDAVIAELRKHHVEVVCLAGFLLKLETNILVAYNGRILNIHPALLPEFGGAGMYGHHVHEAVIAAGKTASGCTVHLVDEEFDHGPILAQTSVPILPGDNADALAARVLAQEHLLYPQTIAQFLRTI